MGSDADRLKTIIFYCKRIGEIQDEFGNDEEDFMEKTSYQYACSFCITQIGENVNQLSPEITARYPEIHWKGIYRMRYVIAHGYEEIDLARLWNSITEEIPILKETCKKILYELENH